MSQDCRAADRQPYTHPSTVIVPALTEAVKDVGHVFRKYPDAEVRHRKGCPRHPIHNALLHIHVNLSASFRGILDSVRHQIEYHLLYHVLVDKEFLSERIETYRKLISTGLCNRLEQKTYFLGETGEIYLNDVKEHLSIVIFSQIGDGFYVFLKDFGGLVNQLQTIQCGLSQVGILQKFLHRSRYQRERRLDLVKEVGVELELVLITLPLFLTKFVLKFLPVETSTAPSQQHDDGSGKPDRQHCIEYFCRD